MSSLIKFPIECYEDIFRHLTGNELLKCTLVSPKWNEVIGSTTSCMAKIKLHIRWIYGMADSKEIALMSDNEREMFLVNSKRQYEFLMLQGYYSVAHQKVLLAGGRRWPHITAKSLDFKSFIEFMSFLRIIEASVQTLIFVGNKIKDDYEPETESFDLQFLKLKNLRIEGDIFLFFKAFANCQNLESLSIDIPADEPSSLPALKFCLTSNKKLKKLEIYSRTRSEIIHSLLIDEKFRSEIRFRLDTLGISHMLREDQQPDFNLFLKTQSASLKTVRIQFRAVHLYPLQTALLMPRLKKIALKLTSIVIGPLAALNFGKNFSVTSLHVHDSSENIIFLTVLLKVLPKIESLKIQKIDDKVANLISEKCESLKRLSVGQFAAENIKDEKFFSNLEEFTCSEVVEPSKRLFKKLKGEFISVAVFETQMWSC